MRLVPRSLVASSAVFALLWVGAPALASGVLVPRGAPDRTVQILDHHVDVVIQNGFARTEVTQTFFNPNAIDLEAVYEFPVPRDGSLAELTIWAGETTYEGEVIARDRAREVYEEERDQGRDAGLAEKNSFYTYRFFVARVPAQDQARFRFVYYQPLDIETGVGRYLYPLEEGGTDEAAAAFWTSEKRVQRSFSFHAEIKSSWPIEAVRVPGFEAAATIAEFEDGRYDVRMDSEDFELSRDVVLYYRLANDLPGRIEVVPFRDDPNGTGTFMVVLTPGLDLQPLEHGSDLLFVLDVSGSMEQKLKTLADGVAQTLGALSGEDRFRIVTFSNSATDRTRGWVPATAGNVRRAINEVQGLSSGGSTNLYAGLQLALKDLDDDRVTSLILVTDGVTNTGEVDPRRFAELLAQYDLRLFGFLLGNSGNWPLMRTMCDVSGGFYAGVSNADDILGQILLAKSKVTHECLHDAKLTVRGDGIHGTSRELLGKVYHGQQLVMFGRYDEPGEVEVKLAARISGEDKVYRARFDLPAIDIDNPELERLWALNRIDEIELRRDRGELPESESEQLIGALGVEYQLVTDETSMIALEDARFDELGIERHNRDRVARERAAQQLRQGQPVKSYRVDEAEPAFSGRAPSPRRGGNGGGAVDPWTLALLAFAAMAGLLGKSHVRS